MEPQPRNENVRTALTAMAAWAAEAAVKAAGSAEDGRLTEDEWDAVCDRFGDVLAAHYAVGNPRDAGEAITHDVARVVNRMHQSPLMTPDRKSEVEWAAAALRVAGEEFNNNIKGFDDEE